MELLQEILTWFLLIVGAASTIVAALKPIAAKTETKTDDAVLAKVDNVLQFLVKLGDKLALNPKK